jgi:hypothetical protein
MRGHWRAGLAIVGALAALAVTGGTAQASGALSYLSNGWVNDGTTNAFAPGATKAPNGDLLVTWNDASDGVPGSIFLARSSDDGVTWTHPTSAFMSPTWFAAHGVTNGSMNTSDALTTLSDGTIVMVVTESHTSTSYTDRQSVTYVLRSTDSGVTWSGKTTPIAMPTPIYFNTSYGRIVELPDGTLLMPVWGALTAPAVPADPSADPTPWQAGVLRSFDGGATWTDYRTIGLDAATPPAYTNPYGVFPSNVTETTIVRTRSGRLLAVMRSDSDLRNGDQWWYESWSSDGGATWSEPVQSNLTGQGQDLIVSPCSGSLPGTSTKLIMAYRDRTLLKMVARVSFDDGVTWADPVTLSDPAGATGGYAIYGAMVPLSGNRVFVAYSRTPVGSRQRVAYNVLQEATDCSTQLTDAQSAAATTPRFFVNRSDATDWPWPYGRRELSAASTALVSSLVPAANSAVTCPTGTALTFSRNGVALPAGSSLAAAGVVNGDVLSVHGPARARTTEVGFVDFDTHPATQAVHAGDAACPTQLGLDYHRRSLGIHQPLAAGQHITSVSLRDSDSTTRLTAADYGVWTSSDNHHWTAVTGWTLTSSTTGGRLTQTFTGLSLSQPYVKVSQSFTDTGYTFAINSTRDDVWTTVA